MGYCGLVMLPWAKLNVPPHSKHEDRKPNFNILLNCYSRWTLTGWNRFICCRKSATGIRHVTVEVHERSIADRRTRCWKENERQKIQPTFQLKFTISYRLPFWPLWMLPQNFWTTLVAFASFDICKVNLCYFQTSTIFMSHIWRWMKSLQLSHLACILVSLQNQSQWLWSQSDVRTQPQSPTYIKCYADTAGDNLANWMLLPVSSERHHILQQCILDGSHRLYYWSPFRIWKWNIWNAVRKMRLLSGELKANTNFKTTV